MAKSKGTGAHLNASIQLHQRAKLFDWCKANKDDKRTFDALALEASASLGFTVTANTMHNHWTAVNGPRIIRHPKPDQQAVFATILEKLAGLEKRLSDAGA